MVKSTAMKRLIFLLLTFTVVLPVHGQDAASDLLGRINGLRATLGLHNYSMNAALTAAAQNQANWMVETGQISHTQSNASTPRTRAQAAGYPSSWVSENIYMGTYATPSAAWQFWLNSPIHYQGMTSDHYYDIGIASATGNGRTSFVLVFGNPTTSVRVAPPITVPQSDPYNYSGNGSTANVNTVQQMPSFIIGFDDSGNIMHEVQPGDTLGDILLIYGYTWEDIQRVRDLNGLTEDQGRNLAIGQVVLIPPWDAPETTTTAASAESTEEPNIIEQVQETPFIAVTIMPSPTPSEAAPQATEVIQETQEWSAATFTPQAIIPTSTEAVQQVAVVPTNTGVPTATVPPTQEQPTSTPQAVAQVVDVPASGGGLIDPIVMNNPTYPTEDDNHIDVLALAVVGQSGLLALAGFEFWRRGRK